MAFDLRKLFRIPSAAQRLAGLNLRPDLAGAAVNMVADERIDAEITRFQQSLLTEESVIVLVEGRHQGQLGLFALTTVRLLFRPHGSGPGAAVSTPLGDISTVESQIKTMTGQVRVRTADSIVVVDKMLGQQATTFADAVRRQLAGGAPRPGRDAVQELLDLRARRAAGMINDADFEQAKRRLFDEL